MDRMKILGFEVIVEEGAKGGAIATVPTLPGCICQADRKEDVPAAMAALIKRHLLEIASEMPKTKPASESKSCCSMTTSRGKRGKANVPRQ